ncbi:MAG TPA: type II toxin-antitoxin system Phd/YefM family antitoxin [Kofleriaceae bacterium]
MSAKSIAVSAFKARCLALLDEVARTGRPLLVTKRGKPLARILPSSAMTGSVQDSLVGSVEILSDTIAPVVPRSQWNAVRESSSRAAEPGKRR